MARIGDSRLVYGTTDQTWGYVRTIKVETTSEKQEAKNGQGDTVAVEFFNAGEQQVSGTYYYLTGMTGGPATEVGTGVEVTVAEAGGTIRIEKTGASYQTGDWMSVDFEGTYYPHLVTAGFYTVSGQVILTTTGVPLEGVTVTCGELTALTDSNGMWSIDGVEAGARTFTPTMDDYTFLPASKTIAALAANTDGVSFTATAD
jgi:hypothetical protein